MGKTKKIIVLFIFIYIFGISSIQAYEISTTTNKNLILNIVEKKNNTLKTFKIKGIKYVKTLDLFVEKYKEDENVLNILSNRISSIYENKNKSVKTLLDYLLRRVNFSLYNIEVKKNNLNTNTSTGIMKNDNKTFTPNLGGGGGGGGSSSSNLGSGGNSNSIIPITSTGTTTQTGVIDNTGTTNTGTTSSGTITQTGVIDNTGIIINTGEINIGYNNSALWGFKDFVHPTNIINVSASGGELRTKIIGGNKIIKLSSGIYYLNRLKIPSNTILEGEGKGKTILKAFGTGYVLTVSSGSNVIVDNLTIDATGNGEENGFEITNGSDNILVDNVEIFGATKSNLIVRNEVGSYTGTNLGADPSENITFSNIKSYGAVKFHGIALKFVKGREILNSEIYACGGYGFDISSSSTVNIGGNYVHNTMGTKYPASDYLYIHDNNISNNNIDSGPGLKIQRECGFAGHLDIENNKILNNNASVRDWTYNCSDLRPHFEEVVFKNNEISGPDGGLVTIYYANKLEVYGINGTLKSNHSADGDPYIDGFGYKTWFSN